MRHTNRDTIAYRLQTVFLLVVLRVWDLLAFEVWPQMTSFIGVLSSFYLPSDAFWHFEELAECGTRLPTDCLLFNKSFAAVLRVCDLPPFKFDTKQLYFIDFIQFLPPSLAATDRLLFNTPCMDVLRVRDLPEAASLLI